jgi:hypothetical protein
MPESLDGILKSPSLIISLANLMFPKPNPNSFFDKYNIPPVITKFCKRKDRRMPDAPYPADTRAKAEMNFMTVPITSKIKTDFAFESPNSAKRATKVADEKIRMPTALI